MVDLFLIRFKNFVVKINKLIAPQKSLKNTLKKYKSLSLNGYKSHFLQIVAF